MISVDRNRIPKPASLTQPNGAGYREKVRASIYYQTPQNKAYPFAYYKENDVIDALNSLFYNKCAYCESKITNTGPIDVEHFRPKGKIEGETNHFGYWWLATEWTNLLSSCIDCNRGRYQIHLSSEDGQQLTQGEKLSGKHDHFPVAGPRATCATDDHSLEDPLLIDPTRVNPAEHINWRIVADHPLAVAVSVYGKTSIDLFGLNRSKLTEARKELLLKLNYDFICLNNLISSMVKLPTDAVSSLIPALEMNIENFFKNTCSHNQYSSFANYFVREKFREVESMVNELLARVET
ncbi:hypothetical protein CIZ60_000852 [Klebsiella aerogenes]|nr:hypothetical protein [Klebsiella aerogenes]